MVQRPPAVSSYNRARRQSEFPTFISCQRQDANVLPKRRQSHQGDKLCDVSTVPLVARWPVFLARGSDADGEPHCSSVRSHFPKLFANTMQPDYNNQPSGSNGKSLDEESGVHPLDRYIVYWNDYSNTAWR